MEHYIKFELIGGGYRIFFNTFKLVYCCCTLHIYQIYAMYNTIIESSHIRHDGYYKLIRTYYILLLLLSAPM